MRAIDTNVLVRLLVRDDAKQVQAAQEFVSKGAWVSLLVLAETIWVLTSKYDRSSHEISEVVDVLLRHKDVTLQDREVVASAHERFAGQRAGNFADFLILEIARKAGHLPVGTFDKRFANLDGAVRL